MSQSPFECLEFSNRYMTELPGDTIPDNFVRQVEGAAYSTVSPTPVRTPRLISFIPEMVETLGLPSDAPDHPDFLRILAGNGCTAGMQPFASNYGGHQFGYWAGQLGDGRAINLGEVKTAAHGFLTLQLKGAGRTPYSRSADGRAVLRSSVREYVCSEALHHLGVPTTRSLSLVATGESIVRDMFYDGHPKLEPGAIVCRVAPSFTRFGHFELPAARGDHDLLRQLTDFSLKHEFDGRYPSNPEGYAAWLAEVATRTARLMVDWQRFGFVHGVMNTDNLSILGLTIDYGPYGWLEGFDPRWTPNTTDAEGLRYAYGQQPGIARWNLLRLANAIYPLVGNAEPLEKAISLFDETFDCGWQNALSAKLGLADNKDPSWATFITRLWHILSLRETDFTLFFRGLSLWHPATLDTQPWQIPDFFNKAWYDSSPASSHIEQEIHTWLQDYTQRLKNTDIPTSTRQQQMCAANPKYVFRNYLAQEVIDDLETGSSVRLEQLLATLRRPFDDQPENEAFAKKRPEWARHRAGCSMLSCSS
jgi:serine/tyrosine/threonine adenylyltransferase